MSSLSQQKILFIDDLPNLCEEMVTILRSVDLDAEAMLSPHAAIPRIARGEFALVITGLVIAELNGFEIIQRIRGAGSRVPIIMVTGYGTEQSAIEAARLGVADYLTKPVAEAELIARVKRVLQQNLPQESDSPRILARMISADPSMSSVFEKVKTIASTESRVLILGETGAGKQVLAHAIHDQSRRKNEPFVEVNCAAIPANLLESELFGHEEGAFTGASKRRIGRFEAAGKGTIFLDEIGELSFDLQSKLLHVLDSGKFCRVGGTKDQVSQARLVSATNRDLIKEVELGRFRADLFYRLNVICIELPPLRERPGDISILIQHFMEKFVAPGQKTPIIMPEALSILTRYSWPGNIRELQNMAEQLAIMKAGEKIGVVDLPQRIIDKRTTETQTSPYIAESIPFRTARDQFEKEYLGRLIKQVQGNLAEGARIAEMDRAQFYRLVKKHGLTSNSHQDAST
ncbi:MAG TPA: hypothetical protein DD473_16095 [Planctomycetaceae bacterium]|nr:hypothetical protein [Planctomycetaceae bacterium]